MIVNMTSERLISRNVTALSFSSNDKRCSCDNDEIIDRWTSTFLAEFDRPKTAFVNRKAPFSKIAFGRTTYPQQTQNEISRPETSNGSASRSRISLFAGTKLSQNRALEVQKKRETLLAPVTGQDSKFRGQQLHNFKIDLSVAKEKRKRQLQYSREIASVGAKSQKQREIDSITRLVVQGFKTLINCERCALFLMNESKKELYFKPIGDSDHSHARLKPICFPSSSGVAGWVASHKMMCNIKNGEQMVVI